MCLVRVFIFVKKTDHMYESFFFFNLDSTKKRGEMR